MKFDVEREDGDLRAGSFPTQPYGRHACDVGKAQEGSSMEDFIRNRNIEAYRRRLAEPLEPADRTLLLKLLREEEAKVPSPEQGQSLLDHK